MATRYAQKKQRQWLLAERAVLLLDLVVLENDDRLAGVVAVGVGGFRSTHNRDGFFFGFGRSTHDTAHFHLRHVVMDLVQILLIERQG